VRRFEDLGCSKEARVLTTCVYETTSRKATAKDDRLRGQMTGAAISVMNNIAEGFDSGVKTELLRFLRYARRSTSAVETCLHVAADQSDLSPSDFERAYRQAQSTRKLIDGFVRYIKGSTGAPAIRRTG
jgi:four helix bundle protein